MKPALIDDQLLGAVLRGSTPRVLRRRGLSTTGLWYVRLCRAVLGSSSPPGQLSAPFATLPPDLQSRALREVLALPDEIGLTSLRDLAPLMGQQAHHQLNLLNGEALAAATLLDATVFVATPAPRLQAALAVEGIDVRVVDAAGRAVLASARRRGSPGSRWRRVDPVGCRGQGGGVGGER